MKYDLYILLLTLVTTLSLLLIDVPVARAQASTTASAFATPNDDRLQDIQQIAAGGSHTCALTTTGGVKCWGANFSGQLGAGMTADRSTPGAVSGLGSGVAALSAGGYHTCVLTTTGSVQCWGVNSTGQLGDGNAWKTTPIDVVAGVDYVVHLPVMLR